MTGKHADQSENIELTVPEEHELTVEEQRAALADTVAALAAKADVPARVQESASAQVDKAKNFADENPQLVIASAASLGLVVILIILRRRRSHRSLAR